MSRSKFGSRSDASGPLNKPCTAEWLTDWRPSRMMWPRSTDAPASTAAAVAEGQSRDRRSSSPGRATLPAALCVGSLSAGLCAEEAAWAAAVRWPGMASTTGRLDLESCLHRLLSSSLDA
jgi:hypothetical protein